ncbi:MAG: rRNA maturation RNase YbeY [Clostridia bacterium]|nr:rRNA maturation RNase YbeY [Clostridia bacterium]
MVKIDISDEILTSISECSKEEVEDYIEDIVTAALKEEKLNKVNSHVTVSSVTRAQIRKFNKEYRDIDRETDVLSFPIFTHEELKNNSLSNIELGDILICIDVVKEQAIAYETGMKREMLYMITHGICHLLGYDHIEAEDKVKMREKEERILSMVGVGKING